MSDISQPTQPSGKLALQTVAMPADTNANGDIFGGWLVSLMDMAAGIEGRHVARSRVVTVAIDSLVFIKPVLVGDTVACYTTLRSVGHTSMKIHIEVWTTSLDEEVAKQVGRGLFTFVAIDASRKPHAVYREKS